MTTPISRSRDWNKNEKVDLDKLWSAIRGGREDALSKLYHCSYSGLFNYGYRIVPKKAFIEDVIQDLFLILWKKRKTINKAKSVKSYLFSSLRRIIFRRIQKQKNRMKRNYDYIRHQFEDIVNVEDRIVEFEVNQERKKELVLAIGSLNNRQKEAIYLKFYNGLSSAEIARVMQINKQSVYNYVSKAIEKMQAAAQG